MMLPSRPSSRGSGTAHKQYINFILVMIGCISSCIIGERIIQASKESMFLLKLLEKKNAPVKIPTVEEKLHMFGCKELERQLLEVQQELAAAKSAGYRQKFSRTGKSTRLKAVIGISTEFGSRLRREEIRKKYMMTEDGLKKLQLEKGIVVRFLIGRSANKGDSSDRHIDLENQGSNDFLILDEHVEMMEDYANKAKFFFSTAVQTWDADYYIKVDDDVYLDIDELGKLLESFKDKPRAYIGCMKSGDVIKEEGQRWYEKEWWKFGDGKMYFRHASGQFYILTRALALYINVNRDMLHTYAHEDISVGSWMLGLDVEHVDAKNICCVKSEGNTHINDYLKRDLGNLAI